MREEQKRRLRRRKEQERTGVLRDLQEQANRLVVEAERRGLTALVIVEPRGGAELEAELLKQSIITVDEVTGRAGAIDLMRNWAEVLEAQVHNEAAAALGGGGVVKKDG